MREFEITKADPIAKRILDMFDQIYGGTNPIRTDVQAMHVVAPVKLCLYRTVLRDGIENPDLVTEDQIRDAMDLTKDHILSFWPDDREPEAPLPDRPACAGIPKAAFFDMDGTLIAPVFKTGTGTVHGFTGQAWPDWCNRMRSLAYKDCLPVEPILAYARKLTAYGCKTKILTVVLSDGEHSAKAEFVRAHGWTGLFGTPIYAADPDAKARIIKNWAADRGIRPEECLLVEDDLLAAVRAEEAGIPSVLVSHVLAGAAPGLG